jgi:hypothetical protein
MFLAISFRILNGVSSIQKHATNMVNPFMDSLAGIGARANC